MSRLPALAVLLLLLAGCDRVLPGQRAAPAAGNLDGRYSGEMIQKSGRPAQCLPRADMKLTLRLGEARGEFLGPQPQGQPLGGFYAFVEPDGRIRTTVRVGTQVLALDGRFAAGEFRGFAENETCSMSGSARRDDAG